MFKQLKPPFGGKGEAPMAKRSEEVCAAAKGNGRSGMNLNFSNRLVRTRMPGGVAGERRGYSPAPLCRFRINLQKD